MTTASSPNIDSLDAKRLLVVSRLQSAKVFAQMGCDAWQSRHNDRYRSVERLDICVIIPLYNYAKYIHQCLESVAASIFEDSDVKIEVLVIDDRSTDNSIQVVEEYLERSNLPICLIKKHLNTGLADVRNIGLKIARAPYVFMLDADNWIAPDCLAVLYAPIKSGNCASTYGKIKIFNHDTQAYVCTFSDTEWNLDDLIQDPYIDAMAMFDKNILIEVGGYSTELVEYGWFGFEDYDLWLKLAQNGYAAKLVPEVLSFYRVHSSSMINTTNQFRVNMARYFNAKFPDLATINTTSAKLFGSWRNLVAGMSYQNLTLRSTEDPVEVLDEDADPSVNVNRDLSAALAQELDRCYETIRSMESSKFWQLRIKWFKLKEMWRSVKIVRSKNGSYL
jgi:glycosyltransferase involved in cell wall biosynthesis